MGSRRSDAARSHYGHNHMISLKSHRENALARPMLLPGESFPMSQNQRSAHFGNRRAMRRAALSAPVLVDTASAYHTGRCRDVSPDGLGLELGTSLAEGATVELYFELPTGVALDVRAEIVRAHGESVGVRFKDLSAEHRRALAAYCDAWRGDLLQRCARRAESM